MVWFWLNAIESKTWKVTCNFETHIHEKTLTYYFNYNFYSYFKFL